MALFYNSRSNVLRQEQNDDESKVTISKKETNKISHDKSELSDGTLTKSAASYSSEDVNMNHEDGHRRSSFSSGSNRSYDSARCSTGKENFFRISNTSSNGHDMSGRQDLHILQNVAVRGRYGKSPSPSSRSSFSSRTTHSDDLSQDDPQEYPASSSRISSSSQNMLEAAEDAIQGLQEEAKMWERNATKLMLDLDLLRKEHSEQSKVHANLEMELSAACAERDGLQNEVQKLKFLLEKLTEKSVAAKDSTFQDEGVVHLINELANDNKFLKESNANLYLQLNRSQESNVELVSVLQELEEIFEKQKVEIENLSELQSKNCDLQESEKNLQAKVQSFEQDSNKKGDGDLNNRNLAVKKEYQRKLSAKKKEMVQLKAKLSESRQVNPDSVEMGPTNEIDRDLIKEIESLKFKLLELASECQELTDENLLLKLEATNTGSMEAGVYLESSMSEVRHHEAETHNLEEKLKKKLLREIMEEHHLSVENSESEKLNIEMEVTEVRKELKESKEQIENLKAGLLLKEEEIGSLQRYQTEVESKLSVLQKEKDQLEENIVIVTSESDIATRCLNDLQNDLMLLSSSFESHVSANKYLQKKSIELENGKHELENQLSKLREENEELAACISRSETQLRFLTDEKESTSLQIEKSLSHVGTLEAEIARLRNDMETEETDHEEKLKEMLDQLSEAHDELEYLRKAEPKLQSTVESLREECSSLQQSNGELERQNMELQENCTHLETKLRESERNLVEYSDRIKNLDEKISSLLEDSSSKEKSLTSQIDFLCEELETHNKKHSLLNQKYLEKLAENESLGREARELKLQLSTTKNEKEQIASDARHEVSDLSANIAKLESDLNTAQVESEVQIRSLMDELDALKQNQETLKAENDKMVKLLKSYKSHEEKFQTLLNDLELKLTVSEYERQQVMDKFTNLKVQSMEIGTLRDEVASLKNELNTTKFEKEKLETSLRLVSEECEALKVDKDSFLGMIATLKQAVSELEGFKENRISVEKELLRMEAEIMAKEALIEQNTELKKEISQIMRSNTQFHRQIKQLEDEKSESKRKAQSLEEELKMMKEKKQNGRQLIAFDSFKSLQQKDCDNGYTDDHYHESHAVDVDPASNIRILQDELAKAMQSNKLYKAKLKRLTFEGHKVHTGSSRKSVGEIEATPEERYERAKSSLEKELREIQDRYLHMSLKYAEVEAQREELVMKLKAAHTIKRFK
ncbi:hypothetical protein K2173_019439 [Erythroxylum novogranatense]|uniref:Uncharacterized protein n=1 Tax=Erythroxylum novogranatense TaxID=1862640 RepID=A0AAV8UAZ9_9ROSI|nr:hypothetical protein K2173_019439 [Erythroxylum novogranatense]